jgi:hypothetical protein
MEGGLSVLLDAWEREHARYKTHPPCEAGGMFGGDADRDSLHFGYVGGL